MNWLGIASLPGAPAIDLQKWTDLIAKHPSLVRFADREGVNPFTKAPMIFRAHPGNAHVVVDGATVGAMTWVEDGPDQIGVEGVAALVEPLAREVASLLGASIARMALSARVVARASTNRVQRAALARRR